LVPGLKVDTVGLPVTSTELKLLLVPIWIVYPDAPLTSPQSKVGLSESTVAPFAGLISTGFGRAVRKEKTDDQPLV
jgi:hypothetical protein